MIQYWHQQSLKRCHFIFENIPRWLKKACHEITLAMHTDRQQFTYYRNSCLFIVHIKWWQPSYSMAGRAELQYSGKIQIQKWPALFRNLQSFVDCSMERSIRYNFFIDLESIQHKLSSDYSSTMLLAPFFLY